MKQTHLYDQHIKAGAKMVPYAGFQMPLQYTSIKEEAQAVRNNAGIFDVSHMQVTRISASKPEEVNRFINHFTCRDVKKLTNGKVQYNAIMMPAGGVLDDITIYRNNNDDVYLISNASRADQVSEQFKYAQKELNLDIQIKNFPEHCLIALQGPNSEKVAIKSLPELADDIKNLEYYSFHLINDEENTFIARTGYTGEDGFEIFLSAESANKLWEDLAKGGVNQCGLAARDNLRMEVFYPLYGNELNESRNPRESGLGRLVDMDKNFLGKNSLIAQEADAPADIKIIRGIIMQNKNDIPRAGFSVYNEEGKKIGEVTSGGYSFTWDCGFGLAFIEKQFAAKNSPVFVEIRGAKKPGVVKIKSPYSGSIKRKNG